MAKYCDRPQQRAVLAKRYQQQRSDLAFTNQVAIPRATAVSLILYSIAHMDEVFPAYQLHERSVGIRLKCIPDRFSKLNWQPVQRSGVEAFAVIGQQGAKRDVAEIVSFFQYRVEHRREVTGRGIDDLKYLCSCGLLLQCLARLGQEPRILHRDHRLRRKILQ